MQQYGRSTVNSFIWRVRNSATAWVRYGWRRNPALYFGTGCAALLVLACLALGCLSLAFFVPSVRSSLAGLLQSAQP